MSRSVGTDTAPDPDPDPDPGPGPGPAEEEVALDTPVGPGRLLLARPAGPATAVLVLGHGAGGSLEAIDLTAAATHLPGRGIAVARIEQPWRTAGRRISAPAGQLDVAFAAAVDHVGTLVPDAAVVVGGRSQGSRVACRCADRVGAVGVVGFAFPLHPPGRPDRSRLPELVDVIVPRLIVQGERDSFGTAAALTAELAGAGASSGVTVVPVPGADHSMRVRRSDPLDPAAVVALLVDRVTTFVAGLAGPGD